LKLKSWDPGNGGKPGLAEKQNKSKTSCNHISYGLALMKWKLDSVSQEEV
jgi:hypothetical protein